MKNNLVKATGTCLIELRSTERDSFTEYHVTATLKDASDMAGAAAELFEGIAALLIEKRIQPIQEKLYGLRTVRDLVLEKRDAVLRDRGLDRTMPATWLEGLPLEGSNFVGLQLWGVTPKNGEVCISTVDTPASGRARLWKGNGFRMLHLPAVRGTSADGKLAVGAVAQAAQMFQNIGAGVVSQGMRYNQVLRTWIYMSRLLEWYDDFNRVRTALYKTVGLGGPGGAAFPASTGIQCRSDAEECLVDVLAVDCEMPGSVVATPIHKSAKQDSSFNYGSAFSRGMVIEIEGKRTVHISGTASINSAGASTFVGDAEHQSLDTLLSIAAILEDQGGGLHSITSSTLFCKTVEAYEAWQRVSRLLQVPAFPKVVVLADVCRDNLLVEMEVVAVI